MSEPKIAAKAPVPVDLNEGQTYYFCTCGESKNQPFCDGSHSGSDFVPSAFTAERTGQHFLCACKQTGNAPYCDGSHNKLP